MQLVEVLERALLRLWPRRRQQELLLDLGERKRWTPQERSKKVVLLAAFLHRELLVPTQLPSATEPPLATLDWARARGETTAREHPMPGVARWAEALAPALGCSGKTLANSVTGGLNSGRSSHRWLVTLCEVALGRHSLDAWCYHRRSPASVSRALARLGRTSPLGASDAMLVLSLVALWQRRRPPEAALSSRGAKRSRRNVAKPVVALRGDVASVGQLRHLAALLEQLDPPAACEGLHLVVEIALTEAHLAPHRARRGDPAESGESWIQAAQVGMAELPLPDRELLEFRIASLRAYRDRVPISTNPELAVRSPYAAASYALRALRAGHSVSHRFDPLEPGLLMLLPQLRSAGLLET